MKITGHIAFFILVCCSVSMGQLNIQAGSERPTTYLICIAGKTGGDVHKNQLLHGGGLEFINKDSSGFVVTSFRMTVVKAHASPAEMENPKSGVLTEAMREALEGCVPGDKVYFEYIRYNNPEGKPMNHTALSFVIR